MPERVRKDEAFGDQVFVVAEGGAEGRVEVGKIKGEMNPADMLANHVSAQLIRQRGARMNTSPEPGRARSAPKLQ